VAGWTAPATFVSGELTSAQMNEQVRDNFLALNPAPISKFADESLNLSTVLQNDNELAYTIADTGTFEFDVFLAVTSAANAAGDIAVGFSFPAGFVNFFGIGPDVSLASGNIGTAHFGTALGATSGTTALAFGCSTATAYVRINGIFTATAAGTLQLMWAQSSSNANNTTVKAGSFMRVRQSA
jgi:hypothetical protein